MPQVDGFTLTEQIRRDKELGSTVIMMLTSGDHPGDAALCERLNIAAYLLKPVKQSELFDAMLVALGVMLPEGESIASPPAPAAPPLPSLRILLAEDSVVNQKLAVALLERQGHTVVVAGTGREALAAFERQPFDVALMDVQMPEMDGLEAAAAIRRRERRTGGHLPIIAMTAHALKGDRERCLEAGMDEYIAKPIHACELFAAISRILPSSPAQDESIDWRAVLAQFQNDRTILQVVVDAAREELPQLVATIRQAIDCHDAGALRLAAHTLKGSLRYFGPTPAFGFAMELEKIGQHGDVGPAEDIFARLEPAVSRFSEALAAFVRE